MPTNGEKDGKSVRFAANVKDAPPQVRGKKRPRIERPNEDEADDVDDWVDDEQQDDLPKTHDLLHAKRQRQERQHGMNDEDDTTHVDATTSLLAENKSGEVTIEPFNMDAERSDGSGYFDGDTYVFRKRDAEEEPDAWLESLDDDKKVASVPVKNDDRGEAASMDDWSKEDLIQKIVPLVSDSETVLQAVSRYGTLLKQENSASLAQTSLNDLTQAANALLLKGDVDIYQKTRTDLLKELPQKPRPVVTWEYRGNQDDKIHGPYTTAQVKSWMQAGYFIGEQAVQIRTISKASSSTVNDLLSDLMDDDDEGEQQVKGEWQSSNDVDFTAYD